MELSREYFRAMILNGLRCGWNQQQCADQLSSTFGDKVPFRAIVFHWSSEFNRSCTSLQDEFREDRLISAVSPENIDAVSEMIFQDRHDRRHTTYREIEVYFGVNCIRIHSVFYGHLAINKMSSYWVAHNLTIT